MKARHLAVAGLCATLLAGSGLVLLPHAGIAQQPPPAARGPQRERPPHRSHIEGRIAFLHAELKITPAQQAQFDKLATVMRNNAQAREAMVQQMRTAGDQPQSAVYTLERRARFIEARATEEKSFADAFKPLYQSLSDDQKKSADELLGRSGGHHGGWRR